MSLIELKNLKKSFHEKDIYTEVLKGVYLNIDQGEVLGIVGASGAGKSTLLHIIGALESETSGRVLVHGMNISQQNEKKRSEFRNKTIGFVFQFHHLLPDFTALENVSLPLLIGGQVRGKASSKAKILLDRVGLSERMHHRPSELSGGEQQRVALARALVSQPKIVLADEPTGNLDLRTGNRIFDLLLELNEELKTTLVIVTHNEELKNRFNRTVRLVDGKIIE